jgi:hypothetical protein
MDLQPKLSTRVTQKRLSSPMIKSDALLMSTRQIYLSMDQMAAIEVCNRPGTAQNKTNLSSSLMCGSNAAGEEMPLHIMFSSDAEEAQNYAVNAAWIVALPRVTGKFGHDKEKSFPASVTTNEKGGTDGRVL